MSWALWSLLILGGGLAVGFAWYERTAPSSRMLSLVATMGALAALGRVAFAPLPQVKPTTTMVLISGYVLGGPAGFVVGAVAALASNVVLGQGPWTPWQMAAWGLVGLLGALIGTLSRGRLHRWLMAGACGVAALGYGAILDLSSWVTYTERTLGQYVLIAGTSLWWNVAHAVASIGFCLAFGPLLVRTLERFQVRFDSHWEPVTQAGGDAPVVQTIR